MTEIQMLFERLGEALKEQALRHGFMEEQVSIQVRPMTPEEAILGLDRYCQCGH